MRISRSTWLWVLGESLQRLEKGRLMNRRR